MLSPEQNAGTWNTLSDWYEQTFMEDKMYTSAYDQFLVELSTEASTVLEFGCGPGNLSSYMLQKRADLQWQGYDYAESMVEKAAKNCPGAKFTQADVRSIRSVDKTYDALVMGFVAPYFSEQELQQYLPLWLSFLKQNAILYLSFVVGDPSNNGTQQNANKQAIDFFYHTPDKMLDLLEVNQVRALHQYEYDYRKADESLEQHIVLIGRLT